MVIRLKKSWMNDGKFWEKGQLLDISDSDGQAMIDNGTADAYDGGSSKSSGRPPENFSADKAYSPQGISAKQFWGLEDDSYSSSDSGFKHFADFCLAVKSGHDPRLAQLVQKDLSTGVASEGGFAVPTEFRNELLTEMMANAHLLTRCLNLPMTSNSIEVPGIYDVDRSTSGLHGIDPTTGIAEGAALDDISPSFKKIQLKLSKIGGRCRVSTEMLEDSPLALSMILPRLFGEAISFKLIDQLINGILGCFVQRF